MPLSQLSRRWNFCSICRSLARALLSWARVSTSRAWYSLHSCCRVSSARSSNWGRPQGMTSSRLTSRELSKAWPSVQFSCSSCSYTHVVEHFQLCKIYSINWKELHVFCFFFTLGYVAVVVVVIAFHVIFIYISPLRIFIPAAFAGSPQAYQHHPPVGCSSQASLVLVPASPQMHGDPADTPGGLSPAPLLCLLPSEDTIKISSHNVRTTSFYTSLTLKLFRNVMLSSVVFCWRNVLVSCQFVIKK